MKIQVTLHGHLPWYHPERASSLELELPEGGSLEELLAVLGVPRTEVALVVINDQRVGWDAVLSDGIKLEMFPVIAGGARPARYCQLCATEYVDEGSTCPYCGAPAEDLGEDGDEELATIFHAGDEDEAEMVRVLLEEAGVEVALEPYGVEGEPAGAEGWGLIKVIPAQRERGIEVLETYWDRMGEGPPGELD